MGDDEAVSVPNVLADRYASPEMAELWSAEHKIVLERRLWIAVMRAQRELGIDIPDEAIGELPTTWNTLDWMDETTKLIHYTSGGPWFEECRDHPFGAVWLEWRERYRAAKAAGDALAA